MECINRLLLKRHKHLTCALVELIQSGQTPSGSDRLLHHPPEAFHGVEVMATMSGSAMAAQRALLVVEGRVQLMGSMDTAPVDDQHDLCPGCAESGHHLLEIVAQLLGITMGDDFREDCGGAIRHSAEDREPHAAGEAAPGAVAQPGLAFQGLLTCDLTLTQRPEREARTLRCTPPARPGQGKAPEAGCVFIEPNDLTTTRLVLEGGQCERAVGEVSWDRLPSAGGTVGASLLFFTMSR
jgi:hypothetical protein